MSYIYLDAGFIQMLKVWMLRIWNATTLRVLRVCVWGFLEFLSHCLWKADMCIIPMLKYQKAFATVSFADCHNIFVAMLEPRAVGCCYVWEWTVSSVIFCGWDLVTGPKKRRSCKKGKGLPASSGRYVSAVPFVKVQKGKVKDWGYQIV